MPIFTAIQGTETVMKSTITIANQGRGMDGNDVRTNGDDGIALRQDDDPMSLGGGCALTPANLRMLRRAMPELILFFLVCVVSPLRI